MLLNNRRELGALIRSLRKKKGWTQDEFAAQLGKTRRWMMQVELGQTNADIATILRALRMLGIRLRIENAPENEHLCLQIAQALGVRAANTTVEEFDGEIAIVVERFDRLWDGQRYRRLHREAARALAAGLDAGIITPLAKQIIARAAECEDLLAQG